MRGLLHAPRSLAGNGQQPRRIELPATLSQRLKARVAQAFDALYQGDDALSRAYQEAQQARRDVMASIGPAMNDAEMQAANNGTLLPDGFPADAARLGTLMRKDPRVQLAFRVLGGWDTHANQDAATGQLANRLSRWARAWPRWRRRRRWGRSWTARPCW